MFYYRTAGFQGYAVKYSPFFDNRLACAASANYGLVGNGRVFVLSLTPQGIVADKWFDTQDALYDVAFSETHENQLVVASGDGSIKLFDAANAQSSPYPLTSWSEHMREALSLSWNLVNKTTFASSSWDGTIKLWSPDARASLTTLPVGSCVYSALFAPHSPDVLSAVASDGFLRVFDLRAHTATPGKPSAATINAGGGGELLAHDWNKYRPDVLATAGVDKVIRVWDLRAANRPVEELCGHDYAVKKLAWSPHWADVLMSASYDMSIRVWTDGSATPGLPAAGAMATGTGRCLGVMDKHTEFCAGVDWCLFGGEGWAASTGWDEAVYVWDVGALIVAGGR